MGWIIYALAWLVAALFWTVIAASGVGLSPWSVLPFGLLTMGSAGIMGVAVWRLSDRAPWNPSSVSFYGVHTVAMIAFCLIYAMSSVSFDVVRGRVGSVLALVQTPVYKWNLLMGSWLYLMIGGLSYAIRASDKIRSEVAAAAEARLLAQQAQLAALRAQMNPHFLFNALHTIGALMASDPRQADRALERLGDLLRYALGTEEEVLFAQEWRFTQDYLSFEELRLGDRLRLDANADAEALTVAVPPLILQPLVENAVRHGIADRVDGGHIHLSARVEDARLILRVRDDGRGTESGTASWDHDGIGLSSVRRRLAALYGGRASLVIDDCNGFGVTIAVPLERMASTV
jgi:LytS/YehU family sensor histidine kinase